MDVSFPRRRGRPFRPFRCRAAAPWSTGASSGLGAHFAQLLAAAGAQVWLAARRTDGCSRCKRAARRGARADSVALDVTRADAVATAFDCDGPRRRRADIVVNNAGIGLGTAGAGHLRVRTGTRWSTPTSRAAWLVATEAAAPAGGGRQAPAASSTSPPSWAKTRGRRPVAPYAASKAGLVHLTKALAGMGAPRIPRQRAGARLHRHRHQPEFLASELGDKLRKAHPAAPLRRGGDLDGPLLLWPATPAAT
jgi:hypothetical protein